MTFRVGVMFLILCLWPSAGVEGQITPDAAPPSDSSPSQLREHLQLLDQEMASVDRELEDLRGRSREVAEQIAAIERERSIGPVTRARLSRLRQDSEALSETLAFLNARIVRLQNLYQGSARRLIDALEPQIDGLRSAYEARPPDSEERAILFQQFQVLSMERRSLRAALFPRMRLVQLQVEIEELDTPDALRSKADLIADVTDLYAQTLSALGGWKRELRSNREIFEEVRRLEEDNDFFRATDPLSPQDLRPSLLGVSGALDLPGALEDLRGQLEFPEQGMQRVEDFDRLLRSVDRLEAELEDTFLAMDAQRKLVLDEARRREETE